eukprot:2289738-Pyramimonas_sp.AAC.1
MSAVASNRQCSAARRSMMDVLVDSLRSPKHAQTLHLSVSRRLGLGSAELSDTTDCAHACRR